MSEAKTVDWVDPGLGPAGASLETSCRRMLRPTGEMDVATAPSFNALLQPFLEQGGTVNVQLRDVTFMDAAGVGVLHRAAGELCRRGVLVVHDPSPRVRRLFDATGLGAVAVMHPSELPLAAGQYLNDPQASVGAASTKETACPLQLHSA